VLLLAAKAVIGSFLFLFSCFFFISVGALMPVSMLSEQVVSAYRTQERENIDTYLEMYIKICTREKVNNSGSGMMSL